MPVAQFEGRSYHHQVSIRYVPADTTAHVQLTALQVGKNEYDFKQVDRLTERPQPNEWHTYSIRGEVKPGIKNLLFYTVVDGNGTFFFDNLTLDVQTPTQAWQRVPFKNGDFEHSATPLAGYETGRQDLLAGLAVALAPGQGPDHSQALRLTFSKGGRWSNRPRPMAITKQGRSIASYPE